MKFELCKPTDFFLRMAIVGPSGSGKTYTALKLATEMPYERIGIIDTEFKSSHRYAQTFQKRFFMVELDDCSPKNYIAALKAAEEANLEVLIIDSLSHAWIGKGGILEQVDEVAKRKNSSNSFAAWKDVTPEHNKLINAILKSPMHIIATLRSKTEYIVEADSKGKVVPRKVGLAPIQRDGVEFEFDIVGEMTAEHELVITKSRCPELSDQVIKHPGAETAQLLHQWVCPSPELQEWVNEIRQINTLDELEKVKAIFTLKKTQGQKFSEIQTRILRIEFELKKNQLSMA